MNQTNYLAIDIGGTFLKYAILNGNLEIINKWKKPTKKFYDKTKFYDYICEDLPDLCDVICIGVSAPGIIDEKSNILSYAAENVHDMYHTNVNEEIGKRTSKFVATMNDAKAAGYCEFFLGNGKGTKSSIYYIIGTGIGGCVCNEKGVVDGIDRIVGEFSYLPIGFDVEGNYRMHTLDASMSALIESYNSKNTDKQVRYGEEVASRYLSGEKEAIDLVKKWIEQITIGLVCLSIVYNPEIICIGGGISEENWFIEAVQKNYKKRCTAYFHGDLITTKIDRCLYNNDANLLGAAAFAKTEMEKEQEFLVYE